MTTQYDVIVAGLGIMGSATAYELARRGLRVLAVDSFEAEHHNGSSHGESRIIRELIFEHPLYVPIVRRAYELWNDLADVAGTPMLDLPGCLLIGPPNGRVIQGAREAAIRNGLPYEELSADAVASRIPAFRPPADYVGIWDARGGYVRADIALRAYHTGAAAHGARLCFDEPLRAWRAEDGGVVVETGSGSYRAPHLVLCAGPWTPHVVPELELPLTIERQVLVWFDPPSSFDRVTLGSFPTYIYEPRPGRNAYGFPSLAPGAKAAVFHEGIDYDRPEDVDRKVSKADVDLVRNALSPLVPAFATAPVRTSTTCLFTNTPDSRFVIDWHPEHRQVLICSPCSGHGFKFAAAIGEINADLITTGRARFTLTPFSIDRFVALP